MLRVREGILKSQHGREAHEQGHSQEGDGGRRKERRRRKRICNRTFWGQITAKMKEGKGGKNLMKQ